MYFKQHLLVRLRSAVQNTGKLLEHSNTWLTVLLPELRILCRSIWNAWKQSFSLVKKKSTWPLLPYASVSMLPYASVTFIWKSMGNKRQTYGICLQIVWNIQNYSNTEGKVFSKVTDIFGALYHGKLVLQIQTVFKTKDGRPQYNGCT